MLKKTIQYKDFDGNLCVDDVYFNITKTELIENMHLKDKLEEISVFVKGPERTLSPEEIRTIFRLIQLVMSIAYGKRSEDGKRFSKSEEMWKEFTETALYDSFMFSLFEDPKNAMAFLTGVLPPDLVDAAKTEIDKLINSAEVQQRLRAEKELELASEAPQERSIQTIDVLGEKNTSSLPDLSNFSAEQLRAALVQKEQ